MQQTSSPQSNAAPSRKSDSSVLPVFAAAMEPSLDVENSQRGRHARRERTRATRTGTGHAGLMRTRPLWLRILQPVLRGLALGLLLLVMYMGIRLAIYGYLGYQNAQALVDLRRQNLPGGRFMEAAYPHVAELQRVVTSVEAEMAIFAPVLRSARIIPGIGETVAAIPVVLKAGSELAVVGGEGARLLAISGQAHPQAGMVELWARVVDAHAHALPPLIEGVTAARSTLAQIRLDALAGPVIEPMAQLLAAIRLLEAGVYLGPELPGLLGTTLQGDSVINDTRTYLLVVQNNHELRATGGFISAVGELTIKDGQIGEVQMQDSYQFARRDVNHPPAPEPFQSYMGIELMFLRDANWSPDFPTTAGVIRALYTLNTDQNVDGIIAIDLNAVQGMVYALDALEVEGADSLVTGDNFIEQVIAFWESPLETGDSQEVAGLGAWWLQRKDFMPALLDAAMTRVQEGQINPLAWAEAIVGSLDAGSMQVWLPDPAPAETLAALEWDGRIVAPPQSDYLAVVDTNVGYNKVDAVLARTLEYALDWQEDGPIATVTLHYHHPVLMPGHVCDPTPRYGENYTEMTERCYYNFVRVYVPQGSRLIAAEGVEPDSANMQRGPNNTQTLSGYFLMKPGESHQVRFVYALPASLFSDGYQLLIRKQAGTGSLPARLSIGNQVVATTLEETYSWWGGGLIR